MTNLLKHMRRREILMLCATSILICAQVYFDLKIPEFIDQLTVIATSDHANISETWIIGLWMLVCLIASLLLSLLSAYLSSRAAAGFAYSLRNELFNKVLAFGEEEINKFSVPSLITRTTNDITQIQMLIAMGLQLIIKSPIMAVWAITKVVGKSIELSLLISAFVIFVVVCIIVTIFLVIPRFRRIQKLTDKINLVVRENINGMNVVHAFNAENYQTNKFEKVNEDITKNQLFIQRVFSALAPIMNSANSFLWFSIYWLGAALLVPMGVTERYAFFGDIVAFAMYASYVLISIIMLTLIFMLWPPAQVSAQRIASVLNSEISIKEGNITEVEKIDKGQEILRFNNVNFKYPRMRKYFLKNISFSLNKGETLAIIGPTASGKTTLIDLMMRFYDVDSGEILVKGKNIKEYSLDVLYSILGLVTQKPVIFYGSVKDNIRFGDKEKNITDDDIENVLKISQSQEFVDQLIDGPDTLISQDGKDISGGQKQRLSIARTIARNTEVIILDDAFSALDFKTDVNLRQQMNKKLKDKTIVMVAQRIGTIKNADKIMVLDKGEIVGFGKHKDLIEKCKVYKEIASSQMKIEEIDKL